METEIIKVTEGVGAVEAVRQAEDAITRGGLVVFPTETVYGVAARADHPEAMDRLRELKSRGKDRAFTVHIGSPEQAQRYVPDLPTLASRFIRKGWPGPLTLVLEVASPSSAPVMNGLHSSAEASLYYEKTIGLRCPDDPIAGAILRQVKAPVVAASANRSGVEPPCCTKEVLDDLSGYIDLLIDAGPTKYAKASTIVRVNHQSYDLLREGVYDQGILERLATLNILLVCTGNTCRSPMAAAITEKIVADRLDCEICDLPNHGIEIVSAGLSAGGGPAAPPAIRVMASRGLELSDHYATGVEPNLIRQADYVFAMTKSHREALISMAPEAKERIQLVLHDDEIIDPIGQGEQVYERCAQLLEEGLTARLQEVDL